MLAVFEQADGAPCLDEAAGGGVGGREDWEHPAGCVQVVSGT